MSYWNYIIFLVGVFFISENFSYASNDCGDDQSKVFNQTLGRCVSKQTSIKTDKQYQKCLSITDANSKKECLKNLAKEEVGESGKNDDSGPSDGLGMGVNLAFSSTVALSHFLGGEDQSWCAGKTIAVATGTLGVAGQYYFVNQAKDDLDEVKEKFENVEGEDDYQTQLNAFKYLKEEQDAIKDLAIMRRNSYWALSAGFAAAAGTSLISDMSKPDCNTKLNEEDQFIEENEAKTDAKKETNEKAKQEVKTKESSKNMAIENEKNPAVKKALEENSFHFGEFLSNPTGVALISTAAAGWNLYLADAASDQADEAEKNSEEILAIIEKFKASVAGNCPQGRDDYKNGRCYCYLKDGKKNEGHSKSETCQKLWAKDDVNFYVKTKDKTFTGKPNPKKGCFTKDKQFDQKCKCRGFIGSDGQNNCFKGNFASSLGGQFATSLSNPAIGKNLNKLADGSISDLNVDPNVLKSLANNSNRDLKKILRKFNAHKKNNSLSNVPVNDALFKQIAKKLVGRNMNAIVSSSGLSNSPASKSTSSSKFNKSLKNARKILRSSSRSGGKGLNSLKNKKKAFKFSSGSKSGDSKVKKFRGNKKYDFKENDIVTTKEISIFKIISNRYTNSGLRRLFED